MDLTPIFRIEYFLDAIINGTTPPEPIFRKEFFLAKIGGADVETPEPIFRVEKYLAKIGGDDVEIPDPVFREEFWLAKKCGANVVTPEPVFRLEYFLEEWVNGSAPAYKKVTGKIVDFITQRIAPLKIEASLTPIQDLHGQDAPWPPGGGKQLYSILIGDDTLNNNAGATHTSSGGVLTISATSANVSGVYATSTSVIRQLLVSLSGTYTVSFDIKANKTASILCGPEAYATAQTVGTSWQRISFTSTYSQQTTTFVCYNRSSEDVTIDVKNVMVAAGSEATFAPYSNECPISGHTGVEVNVTGKNIFDEQSYTITNSNYINGNTGVATSSSGYACTLGFVPCSQLAGQTVTLNHRPKGYAPGIAFYSSASESAFISGIINGSASEGTAWTFAIPATAKYMRFSVAPANIGSIQLELGNESTDYEAFGSSVTISFGQTVYGGQLTVNEDGTGTVKARPYYASYNGETLVGPWVSSEDAYVPGTTPTTGAQVVDMGGTETTISLTPGQVNALQGNNTVWVDDSGEIKVTYRSN